MQAFIDRELASKLKEMSKWFPVVSLTGPRQSGKSTLVKNTFPDFEYVTLEDPQTRRAALEDPVSFIRNRRGRLIIDEAQYAPDLFSMIQVVSDERGEAGQYVLTGSQNFLMMDRIGQSLAGRVGLLKLMPLSYRELQATQDWAADVDDFALRGGYPRLNCTGMPSDIYFRSYIDTYIERDIAGLLDVRNKTAFRKLLAICAQCAGQLLNVASLSRDIGVAVSTVKSWLSILESSYIVFELPPHAVNARKRLTRTPKLYFYDNGLLCHLLGIASVEQMFEHSSFGSVVENLVVSEAVKRHMNLAEDPALCFYRDDSKREIDLLDFTDPGKPLAVEVKSSRTYHDKYARHLSVCDELGIAEENRHVVARVESSFAAKSCHVDSLDDWLRR